MKNIEKSLKIFLTLKSGANVEEGGEKATKTIFFIVNGFTYKNHVKGYLCFINKIPQKIIKNSLYPFPPKNFGNVEKFPNLTLHQ